MKADIHIKLKIMKFEYQLKLKQSKTGFIPKKVYSPRGIWFVEETFMEIG